MDKKYEELSEELSDYWNTRIIKHTVKSKLGNQEYKATYYGIHEVYYDKNDKPVMWSSEPIDVTFEDKEELETLLKQILDAKNKTILELEDETILELEDEKLIDTNIKL